MDNARRQLLKSAGICTLAAVAIGTGIRTSPARQMPADQDPAAFAAKRFLSHWNCTQAVVEALGGKHGADPETAVRMATAFAGGMTGGLTCGAATGAYMVIGLAHGKEGAPAEAVGGRIKQFNEAFVKEFGSLSCSELMGTDMATAEGVAAASKKGMFTTLCPKLVEMAVDRVQDLG